MANKTKCFTMREFWLLCRASLGKPVMPVMGPVKRGVVARRHVPRSLK